MHRCRVTWRLLCREDSWCRRGRGLCRWRERTRALSGATPSVELASTSLHATPNSSPHSIR